LSHFEYVSVALALLNALTVGLLLSSLPLAMEPGRRYGVHAAWVFTLILVAALQWWSFWTWRHVAWSPVRFLWALSLPGLLFVQASLLIGETAAVSSFRDRFDERRVRFFSIGIILALSVGLSPWVLGLAPWFTLTPSHPISASIIVLYGSAIRFSTHIVQVIVVSLSFLLAVGAFLSIPVATPPA